jgi:hypothetical protein
MKSVVEGFYEAIQNEGKSGFPEDCPYKGRVFNGRLILSFLRDWKVTPEDPRKPADPSFSGLPSAMEALDAARPFVDKIISVGMDNAEIFGEPKLFEHVYAEAKKAGIKHAVCHAGEEGDADPFVKDALDKLLVERLDHGVKTIFNEELTKRCVDQAIPLTVCPNSNERLKVFDRFFEGRKDVVR